MTKPRTMEEIADEAMLNSVRATDNMQWCNSVKTVILAALREAADAPSRQIADEARHEEREALREWAKQTSYRDVIALNQVLAWIDARSRSEEPRPGGLNSPTG